MGWIAFLLLLLLAIVSCLWWQSLRQISGLTNFLLLTLLDEANYQKHRVSIQTLTVEIGAENALELFSKITVMVRKLIGKVDQQRMNTAVISTLWELRKGRPLWNS